MPNLAYVNFPLLLTPRMDNRSGLLVVVVLCDAMNRAAERYIGAHLSTACNILCSLDDNSKLNSRISLHTQKIAYAK